MTNFLLPLVSSSLGAAAEALTLAAQVLAVVVGIRATRDALDILERIVAALRFAAEATLLVLALALSALADVAPLVGRALGRYAGIAFRLGRQARALYDAHLAPTVSALVVAADYAARAFVTAQCGDALPAFKAAIAPTASVASEAASSLENVPVTASNATAGLTRRQLLVLAKTHKVRGYSRMTTVELRQALIA